MYVFACPSVCIPAVCFFEKLNPLLAQCSSFFFILQDLQYAYYDASTPVPSGGLEVNGKTLNISTNSLGSTMQQVINQRPSLAVLLYNDEPATVEAARIEIEAEAAGWDRFRDGPLEALQANLSSGSGTSGHSKGKPPVLWSYVYWGIGNTHGAVPGPGSLCCCCKQVP